MHESPSPCEVSADSPTTLCVLMPVYNERYRVREAIDQVFEAPLDKISANINIQLIIVDDGSKDGTRDILRQIAEERKGQLTYIEHDVNQGKGAAIRTAIEAAEGDWAIIQDADLEYDTADYPIVLGPLVTGQADVVYGSRFASRSSRRVLYFWHSLANRGLTLLTNIVTDWNLTDMETCYKAFRLEILKSIPIRSDRFGIEPEVTIKLAKRRHVLYEVPISYYGRTYEEGKKITAWDGVKALLVILKFWIFDDLYKERYGHAILHRLSGAQRFNRWMASAIKPYVGARVLEIGSGMANLSQQILPRDHYTATDIDELYLRYLCNRFGRDPHIDVREVNLEKPEHFEPIKNKFDTVICLNVLEHIEDDKTGLKNMYNALEPGGRAIVLVPRGRWLYGSLDKVLGHFRRYIKSELEERAQEAGFEVEKLFDFNRAAVPGWYLNAVLLKRTSFGAVQLKIFDSLVWLLKRIDWIWPWKGVSWIAVLKKPDNAANSEPASESTSTESEASEESQVA